MIVSVSCGRYFATSCGVRPRKVVNFLFWIAFVQVLLTGKKQVACRNCISSHLVFVNSITTATRLLLLRIKVHLDGLLFIGINYKPVILSLIPLSMILPCLVICILCILNIDMPPLSHVVDRKGRDF